MRNCNILRYRGAKSIRNTVLRGAATSSCPRRCLRRFLSLYSW